MNYMRVLLALAVITLSWGCNRSETANESPNAAAAPARSSRTAELVDSKRVEACAGFTVQTAADILGTSADALEAVTGKSEVEEGHLCRYWSKHSLIGPGIEFVLSAEPSADVAAATLRSLRKNAPAGDAAIRSAIKQSASGPSLIDIEGVGDEAFWDALTSAVNLRVGNVAASIQASSSPRLADGKERADVDLERRVAEQVARGLRAPEER